LSPEGKPLAGAELLLLRSGKAPEKVGVTGPDGRFRVKALRQRGVMLLARAPGVGVDALDLGQAPAGEGTLRTVKDQAIRGRVIDTQGKPREGVTVAMAEVRVYGGNSLDPFLAAWKAEPPASPFVGPWGPTGVKSIGAEAFSRTKTDR